jgi:hypothetical protein
MLSALDERRVQLTEAGKALLTRLDLHPPTSVPDSSKELGTGHICPPKIPVPKIGAEVMEGDGVETEAPAASGLDRLPVELHQSSTSSSEPSRRR